MIVRLSRAKLRRNSESQVFEALRAAVSPVARPDGLEQVVIARKVVDREVELVAMSVWRDMETLIAALGPSWADAAVLPGLEDLVYDHVLEHLESVATSFDDLVSVGR